jgi:hypothetical protein
LCRTHRASPLLLQLLLLPPMLHNTLNAVRRKISHLLQLQQLLEQTPAG